MRILLCLILLAACTHTLSPREQTYALIKCRMEESCRPADAVTIEKEETLISYYCESPRPDVKMFCSERKLRFEMTEITRSLEDMTYALHQPIYSDSHE